MKEGRKAGRVRNLIIELLGVVPFFFSQDADAGSISPFFFLTMRSDCYPCNCVVVLCAGFCSEEKERARGEVRREEKECLSKGEERL